MLGADVPGHRREQLTQTLIVRLLKTHALGESKQKNPLLVTTPNSAQCGVGHYGRVVIGGLFLVQNKIGWSALLPSSHRHQIMTWTFRAFFYDRQVTTSLSTLDTFILNLLALVLGPNYVKHQQ